MKLYVADWGDGTISIVSANNKTDLFDRLDTEGDPVGIKITEIDFEDFAIHFSMVISKGKISWYLGEDCSHCKTKRIKI